MDSKKFKIFTISIIGILSLAGIFFLTGIILNASKGAKESQDSFAKITKEITSIADDYGILTENFLTQTENILIQEEYINAITIQKDKVVFFAYPITSKLLKTDDKGNAFIQSSSPLQKVFTKNTFLLNGDTLTFSVAYNTILPTQIFYLGRITFLIILICVILTFIAIPYIKMKEKENKSTSTDISEKSNIEIDNLDSISEKNLDYLEEDDFSNEELLNEENQVFFEENDEIQEDDNQISESIDLVQEEIVENNEVFDSELLDEIKSENNFSNDDEYYSQEELKEDEDIPLKFTTKNDPMGLFSGISGFGWESYFEPRLDSELVRATSSEQDVSLFIITLPELNKRSKAAEEVYQVILDFFKYRDMIFEYKDDSFAGIHINMNLESAITYAEQLFINLYSIFEAYGLTSKIGIGISTRSMRLVPGNRLISEADQAAQKALDEETMPIVAFKVNHEKYREYVSEEA